MMIPAELQNGGAVRVTAYLTDETFGYDHWRAAQFSCPAADVQRPALLLIYRSVNDRTAAEQRLMANGELGS